MTRNTGLNILSSKRPSSVTCPQGISVAHEDRKMLDFVFREWIKHFLISDFDPIWKIKSCLSFMRWKIKFLVKISDFYHYGRLKSSLLYLFHSLDPSFEKLYFIKWFLFPIKMTMVFGQSFWFLFIFDICSCYHFDTWI